MRAASDGLSLLDDLPPLPASVTTKDGVVFDPRLEEWLVESIVYGTVSFRFSQLGKLSKQLIHRLKLALIQYATISSDAHFRNVWQRFLDLYRLELSTLLGTVEVIELHHLIRAASTKPQSGSWVFCVSRSST
jgi:hypothetical protein